MKIDARAVVASEDLVSRTSTTLEGTADFARKYMEVSRVGTRMVAADQTFQQSASPPSFDHVAHQKGSQGFTVSQRKSFVLQEAELSAEVIRRIEAREAAIERLQAASKKVYRSYIEDVSGTDHSKVTGGKSLGNLSVYSVGLNSGGKRNALRRNNQVDELPYDENDGCSEAVTDGEASYGTGSHLMGGSRSTVGDATMGEGEGEGEGGLYNFMNNLNTCIKEVRLKSVQCVEALGAWARVCKKEEQKKQQYMDNGGGLVPLYEHHIDKKRYCVVIAARGKPLYAQSQAMKSNSKRFTRGIELEKNSIEMRHIGVFDTR